MSEEMLEGDPTSLLVDGLPDLSKYLFIHSSIDDAGLDPYEFRIFCHLRRRAREKDNAAYPGMRKISEVTGIALGKVCSVISSLQKKGFLAVRKRTGSHQTNLYYIGLPDERKTDLSDSDSVHVVNAEENSVHVVNASVHAVNTRESTEGNPSLRSSSCSSNTLKNSERDVFSALPKKKKTKLTVESVIEAVPPDLTLQSPSFLRAWQRWVRNRLELPKPVTLGAFEEHMRKCARWGESAAIAAIRAAIDGSWQTLYEPKIQKPEKVGSSL